MTVLLIKAALLDCINGNKNMPLYKIIDTKVTCNHLSVNEAVTVVASSSLAVMTWDSVTFPACGWVKVRVIGHLIELCRVRWMTH